MFVINKKSRSQAASGFINFITVKFKFTKQSYVLSPTVLRQRRPTHPPAPNRPYRAAG